MTEEEWLTATDPRKMLPLVSLKASDRKLILLAVQCWQRPGRYASQRTAIALLSEQVISGKKRFPELVSALSTMKFDREQYPPSVRWWVNIGVRNVVVADGQDREPAGWLRCVFGNPFRPVAADPSWLTPTVVALAYAIYADRAFDRMPVLADALEEAGCDHHDVLAHCRGDGPHVRGCWVVDLVIGKS
jgi:hypothetical protein